MNVYLSEPLLQGFSIAEISGAALSGEVIAFGYGYGPLDAWDTPAQRLAAVVHDIPSAVVVDRLSAAWVFGALDQPPRKRTVSSYSGTRHKQERYPDLLVSHRRIPAEAICEVGSFRLTTVKQTIIDLALFVTAPKPLLTTTDTVHEAIIDLAQAYEIDVLQLAAEVNLCQKNIDLHRAKRYLTDLKYIGEPNSHRVMQFRSFFPMWLRYFEYDKRRKPHRYDEPHSGADRGGWYPPFGRQND